ncbi:MAG: EVE domain-containing protein [Rickettsiales bacterium]|nr:EVE domain-containing protein [Rickettsiales bacterium]
MKNYWLLKSEPDSWSWQQQVEKGKKKGEAWSGVRNHFAKKNLMAMKKGDLAFFYHSNIGKEIVGIIEIVKEYYPDPTAEQGSPWVVVDVVAVKSFKRPVTLSEIKQVKSLQDISLLKHTRLSVQSVSKNHWDIICKMSGDY